MPVNKMEGALASNPIIEDDQQLYDWGIENRLDQYYQVTIVLDTNWGGGNCIFLMTPRALRLSLISRPISLFVVVLVVS